MAYSSLQSIQLERRAAIEGAVFELARSGAILALARGGGDTGGIGVAGVGPETDGGLVVTFDENGNRVDNTQFYRPDLDPAGSKPLWAI